MPYIGNQPGTGVRSRFIYTATASQTTFSGADDNSKTLKYADSAYVDVFLNGICLVPGTDYTASTKTSIVLTQAASLNDTLEVVAYDIASMSDMSASNGGTFQADVTFADGADIITASAGTDNVRLGEDAGASIASGGNNNVVIGKDAGTALTTGDNNIAIGYSALKTEDTTGNNTAIGYQALEDQNGGSENTAVGYRSAANLTSGNRTTALGHDAALNLNTDDCTMIGHDAGKFATTATNSTFIGSQAGQGVGATPLTGNSNTAVGESTGTNLQGAATFNTMFGAGAGNATTTGTYNTFLGPQAGFNITTGSKNTILGQFDGNAHSLDFRTSSNYIVLSDGDGVPRAGWWHPSGGNPHFNLQSDISQWTAACKNTHGSAPYGLLIQYTAAAPNGSSNEFLFCYDGANNEKMSVRSSGDVKNTNNSYGAVSDIKLKENIADATSQWDDIKAVKVKKYSMKTDESDTANRIGVIAQDLEASGMNGLVIEDVDRDADRNDLGTTTKSVKYSILYMKAVKALQEAMTRIETLETQNTTQATQIADLITRVEALEAG
jgi:hypothetical protein